MAAAAGWDCQRGADGKEWVCVTSKNKPAKPAEEGRVAQPQDEEAKKGPRLETAKTSGPGADTG